MRSREMDSRITILDLFRNASMNVLDFPTKKLPQAHGALDIPVFTISQAFSDKKI